MTITDDPPYDPTFDEPDPTTTPPRSRGRANKPLQDLDAERAAIASMIDSLKACDTIIELGIHPDDFHDPFHAAAYTAICATLEAGETPDPITTSTRLPDWDQASTRLLKLTTARDYMWTAAAAYGRRILHCAHGRRLQGAALEVAQAAGQGDLPLALTRLAELADETSHDDSVTTWNQVDLAELRQSGGPPAPTMLARDDGLHLLYAGKVHAVNAESESGKTWFALAACQQEISAGNHVLYLDFEDDGASIDHRLHTLGCTPAQIDTLFHYVRPDDPIDGVATAALERLLLDHHPTLAIIDGVTEVMVQNGWSINDNDDTARFLLALPRRIARHGAGVVLIDHVPKDKENRGRGGIGAQHKVSGLSGTSYKLEVIKPFGLGRSGASRLTVEKDRPGHIRGAAIEGYLLGEMHLHSLPDGTVELELTHKAGENAERIVRPTTLMERVSKTVEDLNAVGIEPSQNQIVTDVGGKRTWVLEALKQLVLGGYIEVVIGPNRAHHHRHTRPYRAIDDPKSEAYEPPDEPPSDHSSDDL